LCEHFQVKSLDGFGCGQMPQAVAAAGAIVHYLKHQLRRTIDHLSSLRCDAPTGYVLLDAATQTNLELVESRSSRDTSLLAVLDRTATPMGARKLRSWILQPLRDLTELGCRQQMIAICCRSLIFSIRFERIEIDPRHRAGGRKIEPGVRERRDLVALKASLEQIPKIEIGSAEATRPPVLRRESGEGRGDIELLAQRLQNEIQEMPALAEN